MIFKNLCSNDILICSSIDKKKILENLYEEKEFVKFKFLSITDFLNKYLFTYDKKTIYYMMKKYHIKYENALVYLDNLKYIEDIEYNNKLDFLVKLKKELDNEHLLIYDYAFKEYVKTKHLIFYNLDYDPCFLKKVTTSLDVTFIDEEYEEVTPKPIYHFETIDEEVNFVATKIVDLVNSGISVSKIKLVNITSEYPFVLNRVFNNYNLKIMTQGKSLLGTSVGKFFIENLSENINNTIELLIQEYPNSDIVSQIISICNDYAWQSDFLKIKENLLYELKNTKTYPVKYDNEIEITDINGCTDDDFIFMLGFNEENIPKIYKDDEYINDELCRDVSKETSIMHTKRIKNKLISMINHFENIVITYKDKDNFGEYTISGLNEILNYDIKNVNIVTDEIYSIKEATILCAKLLDRYIKYGNKNEHLDLLCCSIDNLEYQKYNNKYTKIDISELKNYLHDELSLSYSAIDRYYHCKFSYYLNDILKIDPYEEKFNAFLGSLIHYILSNAFSAYFDFDIVYNEYLNNSNYELSPKENFFLEKQKPTIKYIIEKIKHQKALTNFNEELYEEKIQFEKDYKIKIKFTGIIDKIMYMKKEDKTYICIVDYKTGNIDTNLKYIDYGITLQLPVYAYLISKSNIFDNPCISGLYYQKLFPREVSAPTQEEYDLEKSNSYKLEGISTNDESVLEQFDSTYQDSQLIKGMKITKNGFGAYSKVFSQNELSNMLDIVDKKIEEAVTNIVRGDFDINPKQIKFKNISCTFCKFKDICYRTEEDIEIIEEGD